MGTPLKWLLLLTLAGLALPGVASNWQAVISPAGAVRLSSAGKPVGTLAPGLFEATWRYATLAPSPLPATDKILRGQVHAPGGAVVDTALRSEEVKDGIHLVYQLTPRTDLKLNSLHVDMNMAAVRLIGGQLIADGTTVPFPATYRNLILRGGPLQALALAFPDGARLDFKFAAPTPVLVQDDRQWGESFSVRIGPQMGGAPVWPAGKMLELDFTLTAPGGIAVEYDGPVTLNAGAEWIPLEDAQDITPGSALDLGAVLPWHTPAGKYGRVIADTSGHFTFAQRPTEPVRFYGCNLCFTGQYLSHDQADRLAERLQRLGYNAVRLHHYEGELIDRAPANGLHLKPDALDQLDYLASTLKARGIYLTTDLYVSRPIPAGAIWEGATGLVDQNEFKMAVPVNEVAFDNYTSFAASLLIHVNPYTKLRWADDPALAWLCLINEGNPGNFIGSLTPRLRTDWTNAWNRWLLAHGKPAAALPSRVDDSPAGIQLSLFLADTETQFIERMRDFLRKQLTCNALLTDMNGWSNPLQAQAARTGLDYVDDHFYVDHPQFLEQPWRLPSRNQNTSPVADGRPGGLHNAFVRLADKPFALTEFNYAWPGRYRGMGGLLTGAVGALQDWSALWRFAYSHNRQSISAPQPADYFNLANDPLNQAADRAAILLFRRGDLRPAPHAVTIALTGEELLRHPTTARNVTPPWMGLALVTRVNSQVIDDPTKEQPRGDLALPLSGTAPTGGKWLGLAPYAADTGTRLLAEMRSRGWLKTDNSTDLATSRYQSETDELSVDSPADTLTVDTPRTAGGYAHTGGRIETRAASIFIRQTDATVWVSSLDGQPLPQSRRLLITHLTDLQNSGSRFGDHARQVLLAAGALPHLVLAGQATITLHLNTPGKAKVWGLTMDGRRLAPVDARVEKGTLVIPLDINANGKARMLYEVEITP